MTALHPSVLAAWHKFSEPLEGRVNSPYVDVKGLVTVGVGNLIDPIDQAVAVKGWVIDGRAATPREVREDWTRLKNEDERRVREGERPLRKMHWKYAAPYTRIRLPAPAIDALVESKLLSFVTYLCKIFPSFPSFPADAQLAVCSMAWAVGPGFDVDAFDNNNGKWPGFSKLVRTQDWAGCVAGVDANLDGYADVFAAKIRETNNPGVVPRNHNNVLCFRNAAAVKAVGADVTELHWPDAVALAPEGLTDWNAAEADTEPAVPHPGPAPTPLAGGFSVAEAIVRDALKGR